MESDALAEVRAKTPSAPVQSVDDVLALAVQDASALIPCERSILFVYNKSANQLQPQFVYSRVASSKSNSGSDASAPSARPPATPAASDDGDASQANESAVSSSNSTSLTGFPPVMGMISACFLHRRCLRMQEPRPVRSPRQIADKSEQMRLLTADNMRIVISTARSIATTTRRKT